MVDSPLIHKTFGEVVERARRTRRFLLALCSCLLSAALGAVTAQVLAPQQLANDLQLERMGWRHRAEKMGILMVNDG